MCFLGLVLQLFDSWCTLLPFYLMTRLILGESFEDFLYNLEQACGHVDKCNCCFFLIILWAALCCLELKD